MEDILKLIFRLTDDVPETKVKNADKNTHSMEVTREVFILSLHLLGNLIMVAGDLGLNWFVLARVRHRLECC